MLNPGARSAAGPRSEDCGADGAAAAAPCAGTAVVRKILSPQMTGEEKPRPGSGMRHAMFLVSLHSRGTSPRAIPSLLGPRQRGQSSSAANRAQGSSRSAKRMVFTIGLPPDTGAPARALHDRLDRHETAHTVSTYTIRLKPGRVSVAFPEPFCAQIVAVGSTITINRPVRDLNRNAALRLPARGVIIYNRHVSPSGLYHMTINAYLRLCSQLIRHEIRRGNAATPEDRRYGRDARLLPRSGKLRARESGGSWTDRLTPQVVTERVRNDSDDPAIWIASGRSIKISHHRNRQTRNQWRALCFRVGWTHH